MKHLRKNGGFTLVELVISIAVASLVTMAATTVLMLALRVNRQTADTATQQYTVRSLLTAVENAATNGNIKKVKSELGSWRMIGVDVGVDENGQPVETEREIFSYNAFYRQILSNGIVVMEDVYASNAILENGLLSISLETREGIFETTVYCRLGSITPEGTTPTEPDEIITPLDTFLAILLSQLNSDGKINYKNLVTVLSTQENEYVPKSEETYYSEWYIGGYESNPQWNPSTPWCACFVSWALTEAGFPGPTDYKTTVDGKEFTHGNWFADVKDFMNFCQQEPAQYGQSWASDPTVGALVFFNFDDDAEADHIGVVYGTGTDDKGNEIIITIEGNSAGYVAVRSYPLTDPCILGYGVVIS